MPSLQFRGTLQGWTTAQDPTVGKHSARDGATVHPLVADALERRQPGTGPGEHGGGSPRASEVGWPSAPGRGEGLGWPGDRPAEPVDRVGRDPEDDGSVLAVLDEAAAREAEEQAPAGAAVADEQPVRRQGWRRFFGGGGGPSGRSTSAA